MKLEAKSRLVATEVRASASPARIAELKKKGYYVEDMGKGDKSFAGQFRWMNSKTGDFQDSETSNSENEAWSEADQYDKDSK